MRTYQVTLSNGASLLVRAASASEAKATAAWQAKRDGFEANVVGVEAV